MESDSIDALIREKSLDPFGFEELVDAWNACFDEDTKPSAAIRSPEFEAAADEALSAIARESVSDIVGPQLRRMIAAFDHPALVSSPEGNIITMNQLALERLDAFPGSSVNSIGYSVIGGRTLATEIFSAHDRANDVGEATLLRAVSDIDNRPATLALIPTVVSAIQAPSTLLFVIDPSWREEAEPLLARSFQLTATECAILTGFLDGKSLGDIAKERRRSLLTVRTQFQTVMAKTGARTQAELMRNMLALSQFMGDIGKVADVATHPFRKRADMLRPGGRTVEVFFAGDLDGDLIVVLPNVTMRTFEASLEARFRREGLCVVTLCRPGYGGSDPPPLGQDVANCLAEDFAALLDQLGSERAVVVAQNTATGFAFQLAGLVPKRITRLVVLSCMPPKSYLEGTKMSSPLAAAFVRSRRHSRALFRLLMHASLRAWKIGGARRVHSMQLASFPPDLELLTPERVEEFDRAMKSRFSQGLDQIAVDFELSTSNWINWVEACETPVTIVHGRMDPIVPIEPVRRFAEDFPKKIALNELHDGGFLIVNSHTDFVLNTLITSVRK